MHALSVLVALFFVALLSLLIKRDPNKWYGDMLCVLCGYRWVSRKQTPPARCPRCGRQHLHLVTINQPSPDYEPPLDSARLPATVKPAEPSSPPRVAALPPKDERQRHQELEQILKHPGVSKERKALSVIALTMNADATTLMHRMKITEPEAEALLQHLEHAGYVSSRDDSGERAVLPMATKGF